MSVEIPSSFYENASAAGAAPNGAPAGAADMSSVYAPPASGGIDGNTPVADTGSVFPDAAGDTFGSQAEAEELRRSHLRYERTIRALGGLYYLIGLLNCLVGFTGLNEYFFGGPKAEAGSSFTSSPMPGLVFVAVGLFVFATGRALRQLKPSALTPTLFISALGLFAFPVGTIFGGAVLLQINSKQSKYVLSPEYAELVAKTPDLKAKTSGAVKFLLAVVVLILVALAVMLCVTGSR